MHIDYPQSAITLNAVYLIRNGERSEGRRIRTTEVSFPNGTGDGTVQTMDVRPGMSLTISDFMFYKDTIMEEDIREQKIFQISFCLDGEFEWCLSAGGKGIPLLSGRTAMSGKPWRDWVLPQHISRRPALPLRQHYAGPEYLPADIFCNLPAQCRVQHRGCRAGEAVPLYSKRQ